MADLNDEEYRKERENVIKILDILYCECTSAGGDGDALWYSTHYLVEELFHFVEEYNSQLEFPMEIELDRERRLIHWGDNQEWITITNNESDYKNAPSWSQFTIKG